MSLETILDELERTRELARNDYHNLIDQFVYGSHDPALSDVMRILAAAGKTEAELAAAISDKQDRNEKREKVAEADAAVIEKQTLLEQIEQHHTKLQAAKQAHDAAVRPLAVRIAEIDSLSMQAMNARRELFDGCNDEGLLARAHSNRLALARLDNAIQEQKKLVERIELNLESLERNRGKDAAETNQKRQRLAEQAAKLESMRDEQAALVEESNSIVEEKINS